MKNHTMKNIIGALLVAIVTCLTMPAIAQPPDSPPKAQPAVENTNAIDIPYAPEFGYRAAPVDLAIPIRASVLINYDVAILSNAAIERPPVIHWRSPVFRVGPSATQPVIRAMSTAPPLTC